MEVLDCVLIGVAIVCHFVCNLFQRHLRMTCFIHDSLFHKEK